MPTKKYDRIKWITGCVKNAAISMGLSVEINLSERSSSQYLFIQSPIGRKESLSIRVSDHKPNDFTLDIVDWCIDENTDPQDLIKRLEKYFKMKCRGKYVVSELETPNKNPQDFKRISREEEEKLILSIVEAGKNNIVKRYDLRRNYNSFTPDININGVPLEKILINHGVQSKDQSLRMIHQIKGELLKFDRDMKKRS